MLGVEHFEKKSNKHKVCCLQISIDANACNKCHATCLIYLKTIIT